MKRKNCWSSPATSWPPRRHLDDVTHTYRHMHTHAHTDTHTRRNVQFNGELNATQKATCLATQQPKPTKNWHTNIFTVTMSTSNKVYK